MPRFQWGLLGMGLICLLSACGKHYTEQNLQGYWLTQTVDTEDQGSQTLDQTVAPLLHFSGNQVSRTEGSMPDTSQGQGQGQGQGQTQALNQNQGQGQYQNQDSSNSGATFHVDGAILTITNQGQDTKFEILDCTDQLLKLKRDMNGKKVTLSLRRLQQSEADSVIQSQRTYYNSQQQQQITQTSQQ